jgi:hypothetical protein
MRSDAEPWDDGDPTAPQDARPTAPSDAFPADAAPDLASLEAEHGPVGARLRAPAETVDLAGFAARLHGRRVVVTLEGLAGSTADPGLAGRIRGAFGLYLAEAASEEALAGRPCRFDPPSAFEALFRKQGRMTAGTDFPSPWVVGLAPRRGDLDVTLTVFGFAAEWMPAVAEALTAILMHRVDWAGPRRLFVPRRRILGRRLEAIYGLAMPAVAAAPPPGGSPAAPPAAPTHAALSRVLIETLSPMVSSGAGARADPAAPFAALGRRLEGLARWHDLTIAADWRALAADLRAAHWHWLESEEIAWTRGSRRQDGRVIPMRGIAGRLLVEAAPDRLARLLPLFALGAETHAGADIAFGCGAYRVNVL